MPNASILPKGGNGDEYATLIRFFQWENARSRKPLSESIFQETPGIIPQLTFECRDPPRGNLCWVRTWIRRYLEDRPPRVAIQSVSPWDIVHLG